MKFLKSIVFWYYFLLNYTHIHWKLGYKRVKRGENGCKWMWMDVLGRRGHGEHKNKARRGHLGPSRPWFGPYGRGNFPGHHVLLWFGAYGFAWVWEDAYGFLGVHCGAGARAERKITGKQAKLDKQVHKIACQPKTTNWKKKLHHKNSQKIIKRSSTSAKRERDAKV